MNTADAVALLKQIEHAHADKIAQKDAALDLANTAMIALQARNAELGTQVADLTAQHAAATDSVPDAVVNELQAALLAAQA